jgi:quercetin dioxygenase-like cupin family protein
MTLTVRRRGSGVAFQSAGHTGVVPKRMLGLPDDSSSFSVVISEYAPGAGAESAPVHSETVYAVISGRLTLATEYESVVLTSGDVAHLENGTARSVENVHDEVAILLVIRPRS